jgi:hypothetical protein
MQLGLQKSESSLYSKGSASCHIFCMTKTTFDRFEVDISGVITISDQISCYMEISREIKCKNIINKVNVDRQDQK